TVSPMDTSKLMMRPVILSRPENSAEVLTTFCVGGSATTSSPGCGEVSAGCPRGWRWIGGGPGGSGWLGGTVGSITATPGGGGKGCDWTPPLDPPRALPCGG